MKLIHLFLLLILSPPLAATEYQNPESFVSEAFSGSPPAPKTLWISKDLKPPVTEILQHKPGFMRTRYWREADRTVWILEEIGKTKPITVGIIVDNNAISEIKVLVFRESRGWEVKHAFFTDQFKQATLQDDYALSEPIDGISGATLSVRALTKTAKLALLFEQQTRQ